MKIIASCFGLFLMTSVVSARVIAEANTARELNQNLTIADYLKSNSNFSTFVSAASSPGIYVLSGLGQPTAHVTLFGPENDDFSARNTTAALLQKLLQPEYALHLQNFLDYHVYPGGAVLSTSLNSSSPTTVTMANKETLTINLTSSGVTLSNKKNGVMATVTDANILASNGVIHAIDNVLHPSFVSTPIVHVVETMPELSTLLHLIVASNLFNTLRRGSYTLLAPTNTAFKAMNQSELSSLFDPANEVELQQLLAYHILPNVYTSKNIGSNHTVTLDGLVISFENGTTINGGRAKIVSKDHLANNGALIVIDAVLVPPALAPTAAPASSPTSNKGASVSNAASSLSKVATTLLVFASAAMAAMLI
jgi:uncharacterized surface protein with fasciclin (FAS1) repeats